jgi:hypothetical protein
MTIWNINIDILVEKEDKEKDVAFEGSKMEDIIALDVGDERVRAMLE